MSNHDVTVVGNVGIDTCVFFPYGAMNLEQESNFTENLDYIGQAGGFSARGFARLGWQTAFVGYVGDDANGRFILDEFARDGINTEAVFIDPAGTSRSINFMHSDGRRRNFYDGKSHLKLQPDLKKCETVIQQSRLAHFHIPDWARTLLPIAKRHGLTVACDIQDVVTPDDNYRFDFIRAADILFFSAVNHADPAPLMHCFNQMNSDLITVSGMGSRGCAVCVNGQVEYFAPVEMTEPVIDANVLEMVWLPVFLMLMCCAGVRSVKLFCAVRSLPGIPAARRQTARLLLPGQDLKRN
jgi:sugar/nucleoside kinase (ribokinase family)